MMGVCGGVHSKTVREHSFFREVQDAPEEVASIVALLGAPVPCQGCK